MASNQISTLKMERKFKRTPIGEIPVEWEIKKLGSLCLGKPEYGANVSAIEYQKGLPRYVRITDVLEDGSLNKKDLKCISKDDSDDYLLQEGDILFARSGATVGKTYLYRKSDGQCAFAGYMIRFKPDKKNLLPEFLFQITHSPIYYQWVNSVLRAGAQPNINGSEYSDLLLSVPPIDEQQRIVEILSALDDSIEKSAAVIEKTKEVKKGLMQHFFAHYKNKTVSVGDCVKMNAETLSDETAPKSLFRYIDISSIERTGEISKTTPIIFESAPSRAKRIVRYGDILVSTVRPYLRAFAQINFHADDLIASTGFTVLSPVGVNGSYLYQFILSDPFVKFLEERMTGSSYPAVNPIDISESPLPLPPRSEQEKIAEILSKLDDIVNSEHISLKILEQIKKSLMQVLLTGKVRV